MSLLKRLVYATPNSLFIHPFREGNGRLARLLATVMALQADMPPLDFNAIESDIEKYIKAIHAGYAGDYQPMKQIFTEILNYSRQQASQGGSLDSE